MGFGLNLNAGGDFLPIIKYDARAGRFFRVDRDDSTGEREPVDITDGFECLPDFEHAEKGWAWFQPGQAPDFLMVSVESKDLPPQPSKNHRKAVRLRLMAFTENGRWRGEAEGDHDNGERRASWLRDLIRRMARKSRSQP